MLFNQEKHECLRGGTGTVTTYTMVIRLPFAKYPAGKFIILSLDPSASIGLHKHTCDSEVYVTFSRHIRFNGKKKWSFMNRCKRGMSHSAKNTCAAKKARIFAYKH